VLLKSSVSDRVEAVRFARDRSRIRGQIASLGEEPRPPTAEPLPGYSNRFRMRLDHFRILYQIDDLRKIVTVFGIAYRQPQEPAP
jgi:mRNA interferase RelE/StbE